MQGNPLEEYLDFLEEYGAFLGSVLDVQKRHLEALLTHDVTTIDQSTARQQAVVMRLKNFEEARIKKQAQAGLPGDLPLSELTGRIDGSSGQRMRRCLETLRSVTDQIRYFNEKIVQTAQTNLRVINLSVPIDQRKEAQRYTEGGKQTESQSATTFFGTEV